MKMIITSLVFVLTFVISWVFFVNVFGNYENLLHLLGAVTVATLMAFLTYRDVSRIR